MLQIAVLVISAVLGFVGSSDDKKCCIWIGLGVVLLMLGFSMLRINSGIKNNNIVLAKAGIDIGDTYIPSIKSKRRSVSFWVSILIMFFGFISLIIPFLYA